MLAQCERLLRHPRRWTLQTGALFIRSQLEKRDRKLTFRAMMQLEVYIIETVYKTQIQDIRVCALLCCPNCCISITGTPVQRELYSMLMVSIIC